MRGGHGCECRYRCEGSQPLDVNVLDRWAVLPHAHNQRVLTVGTAPALAKGASSIEPASGAEKANVTKLEALEPMGTGHIYEVPSPGGRHMSKPDVSPLEGKCMVEIPP